MSYYRETATVLFVFLILFSWCFMFKPLRPFEVLFSDQYLFIYVCIYLFICSERGARAGGSYGKWKAEKDSQAEDDLL